MPRGRTQAKRDPKTGQFLKLSGDPPGEKTGDDRTGQVNVKKREKKPRSQKPPEDPPASSSSDRSGDDYGLDMFCGGLIIEL